MRACVIRLWAIGFIVLAAAVSFGDESPAAAPPSVVSGSLEQFAHRVLQITDLVLDHHVEPPTRQEMLLCGLTALLGDNAPEGLSRAVSAVASEDDFVNCLIRFWPAANENWPAGTAPGRKTLSEEERGWRFLGGVSNAVPGGFDILPANEAAVQRQLADNQYVGLGVALAKHKDSNSYQFAEVFPRGTAAKAGIQRGEILLAVEGAATDNLPMRDLVDRLRGAEGTTVIVKVARDAKSEPRLLTLVRSVVPRQTVTGYQQLGPENWESVVPGDRPVGYLMINEIGGSTVAELREYEAELTAKHVKELVLDLRFADGADLRYAIALADAFIDGGNAGWVRWRDGRRLVQLDRDCLFRDWPVAVLVGEYTDGYAEWIAAALQKMRGAVAVGLPTQGEPHFVMAPVDLPDDLGVVLLATKVLEGAKAQSIAVDSESLLFRLSHYGRRNSNQREAVVPNVAVPLASGEHERSPDRQPRLVARAIEALAMKELAHPPKSKSGGLSNDANPAP